MLERALRVSEPQRWRTSRVHCPVRWEGHIKRGRAAVECKVHSLNCVALITLFSGGMSKCSAAQDEGDGWKCESHV